MRLVIPFVIFASPAFALCEAGEETFMSCQIENSAKSVAVCFDDAAASYRFGIKGQTPELVITTSIADLDYVPWNGIGRAIWEAVRFSNGDYTYEAHGGFDRMFGLETDEDIAPAHFGGVSVTRGDALVVDLDCDRTTVTFAWDILLGDAKRKAGLSWDDRAREWVALP